MVRVALTLSLTAATALVAIPACSSGDDFTSKNTGGTSNTGGNAGDASTTGGTGGSGGSSGTSTGGVAGTGTGGVAGSGTGGVAGSGTGGAAGSASGGTGGNPGGKDNGQACANKTECKSNYCVDDVCCESACSGDCRTCKASGKEGLCTPYSLSTDPEGECVGAGAPTDPCAGSCDGKGACDYPDTNKSCGAQVCTASVSSTFACDNAGACKQAEKKCGNYQCSGVDCFTACTADAQCVSAAYCDPPNCNAKKAAGAVCAADNWCLSGICVANNCCATTCDANFTCETGACQCGGQTCGPGATCSIWYQDKDKDGYGNLGAPKLACTKPVDHVANSADCDDGDPNAFPGQTKFFSTPRLGVGGYDYNCDSNDSPFYANVTGKACGRCAPGGFCNSLGCDMGWGCNPTGCSGDGPAEGYFGNIACGQPATLQKCLDNPGVAGCQNGTSTQANVAQPCR